MKTSKTAKMLKQLKSIEVTQLCFEQLTSGLVIWLTGLPCSGKSTIAELLQDQLATKITRPWIIDGDLLRAGLCADLSFSKEDRHENIRRVAHLAAMLADRNQVVITAFVSPYQEARTMAAEIIGEQRFFEVFVGCPVEVCEQRDVKGMYARALAGEIKDFTGVDDPYERPEKPFVRVETDKETPAESARAILSALAVQEGEE